MASVLSLKTDIKKLKAAIASKATSGAIKTKLRGKLTNLENQLDKLQPNKRKPKTTGPKNESALVRVAKKRRTNQGLSTSKEDIERDAIRPAKKAGKRISANGNRYYEYRDNRIDNRQPPRKYRKLADGGMMAKGGKVGMYELMPYVSMGQMRSGAMSNLSSPSYKERTTFQGTQDEAIMKAKNMVDNSDGRITSVEVSIINPKATNVLKMTKKIEMVRGTKMDHGGYMADGAKTQGYDDKKDESLGMTRGKLSLKDFVGNRKQKEHSRRDDARFEERGMMAKGGDLSLVKKKYEENEDENAHSENVVLLAKHFGTKADLAKAKEILALHEKEGYLSSENGKKRTELHYKLIDKARSEMGKQGIKFEKGGYMADGGAVSTRELNKKIKSWYMKTYPTDDMGKDIRDEITFKSLWNMMHQGYDVYEVLDVYDSVVRERVFEKLSKILGVDYDVVYNKWLGYADGGMMAKGGKTKDQEVVRGYFEDEAYEYADGGKLRWNNVSIHISKNTEEDMRNAGFSFDPKGNAPLYYKGKEVGYLSNFNGVMLNDEFVDELVPMFNTFRDAGVWNYRGW